MRGLFFFMLSLEKLQSSNSIQDAGPREAPPDPPSSTDRTKLKGLRKGYIPYMLFVRRSRRCCGISFVSTISIFFFFFPSYLTDALLYFLFRTRTICKHLSHLSPTAKIHCITGAILSFLSGN